MKITKGTTTRMLNDSFVGVFPYLKLAFYKKSHDHFRGSHKQDEIDEIVTLETLNPDLNGVELEWNGKMTVDNLETYLEDTLGLHVQVFRKSGDIWLQTSITDHWTLDEQNSNGAENEKFTSQ